MQICYRKCKKTKKKPKNPQLSHDDFISVNKPASFPLEWTSELDTEDTENEFKGNPMYQSQDGVACLQILEYINLYKTL